MEKMSKSINTKKVVLAGLMTALVFLATRFTAFPGPLPPGYINRGDVVILIAAVTLGPGAGLVAGAFGSMLADLAFGAVIYMPVTFVVKGLEGFLAGFIAYRWLLKKKDRKVMSGTEKAGSGSLADIVRPKTGNSIRNITAITAGALFMVAGYFLAEAYILGLVDKAFGLAYAFANLPMNLIQCGLSILIGYLLLLYLPEFPGLKHKRRE